MNRSSSGILRLLQLLLALVFAPLCCVSCAEVTQANDTLYDRVFERSRQRRIQKDIDNLKAGRPLQYYRSSRDLYNANRTGRD